MVADVCVSQLYLCKFGIGIFTPGPMALPRLFREGYRTLGRLAHDQGPELRHLLAPSCASVVRGYAAEPAPVEGIFLLLVSDKPLLMDFSALVPVDLHILCNWQYITRVIPFRRTVLVSYAESEMASTTGGSSGDPADSHIEMKGIRLRGAPMYLDMQATTPLDPRVLDATLPYLTEQYGNPHSRTHLYGWESEDAMELARKQVNSDTLLSKAILVLEAPLVKFW